ncbi:MAG: hypothetical protein K1X70_09410, partial [Leptospirales bacterium]|nr:hypothetical protein [Leptospirales bacterium]
MSKGTVSGERKMSAGETKKRKSPGWRRMTGAGLLVPMIMWIMFPSTVILSQPVNVPGLQTGSPNQN